MKNTTTQLDIQTSADDYVGQKRAVDTRLSILDNAAKIFATKGYDGCSTRDIALAADVSHATIRYHFGDKEALFFKVIQYSISESYKGRKHLTEIESGISPTENFRQHTRNAILYYANHPELPRIVLFETLTKSDRLDRVEAAIAAVTEQRSKAIEIMQDANLVKDVDPIILNEFIGSGLAQRFVISKGVERLTPEVRDDLIDSYTDLIVKLVSK